MIPDEDLPAPSPDLNSQNNYSLWQFTEGKACAKPHKILDSLKKTVVKVVEEIDLNVLRITVNDVWPGSLQTSIRARI